MSQQRPWYQPPAPEFVVRAVHQWYGSKDGTACLMEAVLKFREREQALEQRREQIGGH